MSSTDIKNINNLTQNIIHTVRSDKNLNHCRINIVNGIKNVFTKYKRTLSRIETSPEISVRFYSDHNVLHEDLFVDPNFMANDWFNLFVFNIGKNGKTFSQEIHGVELITLELMNKFDSKYYSTIIVSELNKRELTKAFEQETGKPCPVANQRYLEYDFDGAEILFYLNNILHTHSTEFLYRWASALKKLEQINDDPLKLTRA